MSREIKFRGKRKDNGEWVNGLLIYKFCCGTEWHRYFAIQTADKGEDFEVDFTTVGQFTGLKDWWEGDLFRFGGVKNVRQIIYSEGRFVFKNLVTESEIPCFDTKSWSEVNKIGNAFDNPELLEAKK